MDMDDNVNTVCHIYCNYRHSDATYGIKVIKSLQKMQDNDANVLKPTVFIIQHYRRLICQNI